MLMTTIINSEAVMAKVSAAGVRNIAARTNPEKPKINDRQSAIKASFRRNDGIVEELSVPTASPRITKI